MWEGFFNRALSEREVTDAVTALLQVTAPETLLVDDVTETEPGPEVRVLCECRPQRGQFPFRLTLYLRDDSLHGRYERQFFQGLSAVLGCACLLADRSLSPHSMLLLQSPGRASRVCLDPDRLEEGEYVLLRSHGSSERPREPARRDGSQPSEEGSMTMEEG